MVQSASLLPREHGVYAEVAFPLATGLALGGFSLPSVAFATAVTSCVLVHEPFAIRTGRRGKRLQDALADEARRRIVVLSILGTVAGVTAVLAGPPPARLAALLPLAFALLLVPAVVTGRAKTLWGELLVVAALTTSLVPVALAGGGTWPTALAASGVWLVSFALGTATVHAIKQYHKGGAGDMKTLIAAPVFGFATIGGTALIVMNARVPPAVVVALLPPVIVAVAVSIARVHPRNLRRVGWSLVGANVLTLTVLLLRL